MPRRGQSSARARGPSGWTRLSAVERSRNWVNVTLTAGETTIALTTRMLGLFVKVCGWDVCEGVGVGHL